MCVALAIVYRGGPEEKKEHFNTDTKHNTHTILAYTNTYQTKYILNLL